MDLDRWVIEHLLRHHDTGAPLWTATSSMMSLDGSRGTFKLEEAIQYVADMQDHWLFRHREMRIRNIDTEEIVPAAIL